MLGCEKFSSSVELILVLVQLEPCCLFLSNGLITAVMCARSGLKGASSCASPMNPFKSFTHFGRGKFLIASYFLFSALMQA